MQHILHFRYQTIHLSNLFSTNHHLEPHREMYMQYMWLRRNKSHSLMDRQRRYHRSDYNLQNRQCRQSLKSSCHNLRDIVYIVEYLCQYGSRWSIETHMRLLIGNRGINYCQLICLDYKDNTYCYRCPDSTQLHMLSSLFMTRMYRNHSCTVNKFQNPK